ncbi:crossover junction endonuclease MUS81 [Rhypophila sp. PSN 637]
MPPSSSSTPSPNPLLLAWVKEWWDVAKERNTKGAATYKHAYDSLKACPMAFDHPSELIQLKGFGPKLCARLTDQLQDYCEENGLPMPAHPSASRKRANKARLGAATAAAEGDEEDEKSSRPAKKPRKTKPYVPTLRSGAYAIVLALSDMRDDDVVGMTKDELIAAAQPHCNTSFTAAEPGKYYTAWASIKTLEQKELVYQRGRPLKRYALTDEGLEVARRIREQMKGQNGGGSTNTTLAPFGGQSSTRPASVPAAAVAGPSLSTANKPIVLDLDDDDDEDEKPPLPRSSTKSEYADVVKTDVSGAEEAGIPPFRAIRMPPGLFTVELVLDVREVRAKDDRDYMQQELTKKGIKPIMRALELGDALWVAKCNQPGWLQRYGGEGDEVVLDWIVERKRLDDLITSIKDGRFHEQKFRLRRSGVKNVIYLVEEIGIRGTTYFQKYEEAVQSAVASIQVVNGYFLKKTPKMDDTIRYLASMTRMLKKVYEDKPLHIIPAKVLTDKNYLPILKHLRETQSGVGHYISYPAFASLASKSEMMTLRDVFLKMLMCTKGVTGEKAIEIQKTWKTPNDLVKAYEACGTGEEGRKKKIALVQERLAHLLGRKKIPRPVSQKIAEVWGGL